MQEILFDVRLAEEKEEVHRILRLIDFMRAFAVKMKMPITEVHRIFTALTDRKGELTVTCHSVPHAIIKEVITTIWDDQFGEYETVFEWNTDSGFECLKVTRNGNG